MQLFRREIPGELIWKVQAVKTRIAQAKETDVAELISRSLPMRLLRPPGLAGLAIASVFVVLRRYRRLL